MLKQENDEIAKELNEMINDEKVKEMKLKMEQALNDKIKANNMKR